MNFKKLTPYLLMSGCLFGSIGSYAETQPDPFEAAGISSYVAEQLKTAQSNGSVAELNSATTDYVALPSDQQQEVLHLLRQDPNLSLKEKKTYF